MTYPGKPISDGRDIDTSLGMLQGEAAEQLASPQSPTPLPWDRLPESAGPDVTYYQQPLLKKSVWSIDIPLYYFLGGTAGAALTLGAALQFATRGESSARRLSAICHWTGVVGSTAGAAFLIHDLGRPSRFLYMMRVFRPSSPMNMGTWILSSAAPTAIFTALFMNSGGLFGRMAEATGYLSGIFGAALAGYTGVLVSNSAIPLWQQARRWLPVLFMASSATAAASVIDILCFDQRAQAVTLIFGTAGRLAELAAAKQVEVAAAVIPQVGKPLQEGASGFLWKLAAGLTVASLVCSLLPGRSRKRTAASGVLGVAGSLCLRFAVHHASNASALDPRASFQQQRSSLQG